MSNVIVVAALILSVVLPICATVYVQPEWRDRSVSWPAYITAMLLAFLVSLLLRLDFIPTVVYMSLAGAYTVSAHDDLEYSKISRWQQRSLYPLMLLGFWWSYTHNDPLTVFIQAFLFLLPLLIFVLLLVFPYLLKHVPGGDLRLLIFVFGSAFITKFPWTGLLSMGLGLVFYLCHKLFAREKAKALPLAPSQGLASLVMIAIAYGFHLVIV